LVDGYAAAPAAVRVARRHRPDGVRGEPPIHVVPGRDED
jgi:hypothetical protein